MDFTEIEIKPIQIEQAYRIIAWEYDAPYDIYNMDNNEETIKNFMNNNYHVLTQSDGEIIGYYCYGEEATIPFGSIYKAYQDLGYLDIGLGLNPKYVSRGLGAWFLTYGIEYLSNLLNQRKFRLTVLENNIRGRKLYSKMGFRVRSVFPSNFKENNFIVMVKDL